MNNKAKLNVEYFNELKSELDKRERSYAYNIVHLMNIEPSNTFVSINLTPLALMGLISYIEHFAFDLTYSLSYAMCAEELLEIINEFYTKVTYLNDETKPVAFYEIDLYFNWEYHSNYLYKESIPELKREGLSDYIQTMATRNKWGVYIP